MLADATGPVSSAVATRYGRYWVAAQAGVVTPDALATARASWVESQRRRRPNAAGLIHFWRDAYGEWVRTPDDARLALDALEALRREGLRDVPRAVLDPGLALALGQTYLLTGRQEQALPMLEFASSSCTGMLEPFRSTRAQLMVAKAREERDDVDGARAAYGAILQRWGPPSVTAAAAQARLAALSPSDAQPSATSP